MLTVLLFFVGFVALIKGAEVLIEGASHMAKRLGVSDLIVGLTIVAFGTSLPELIISLFANSGNIDQLAISNVLGSNIANILLVLGVAAIIHPLKVKRVTVYREVLFGVLASIMLAILVIDQFIGNRSFTGLDQVDGIVLVSYFAIFLYYSFGSYRLSSRQANKEIKEHPRVSIAGVFFKIFLGIAGLYLGGEWIVDGAVYFASIFELSEALIGLSIVAIGTSLPELASAAVAAKKRNIDMAIGGIVGSNLFNILWVLGLNAAFNPLFFNQSLISDVVVMITAAVLLFAILIVSNKHTLKRGHGIAFIGIYIIYIALSIIRG